MFRFKLPQRALALTALALAAGTSQASITLYTSEATFLAALASTGHDYFADLAPGFQGTSNVNRSTTNGQFGYSANGVYDGHADELFVAGTVTDHWLSLNDPRGTLFMGSFSVGVNAVGVYGVSSGANGAPQAGGMISVSACPTDVNASCLASTYASQINANDFRGFISTDGFRYVSVASDGNSFPSVSALHLGVAAVPEPGTAALLLAGMAGVGAMVRRR